MRAARWIVGVLVLVLVGGLVGYWYGDRRRSAPLTFSAAPVPASSPSYPVTPPTVVPDSTYPGLAPGVATQEQRLRAGKNLTVTLPIPQGWVRNDSIPGEWKWYPSWSLTSNIYFIRVRTVANAYQPVDVALRSRIDALRGASAVYDLHLESQQDDRFVANYVNEDHRRVSYEGFLDRDDSGTAYLYVAVIGREADRAGLADLFDRLMSGTRL